MRAWPTSQLAAVPQVREGGGEVFFEPELSDVGVWGMYRPARFVRNVRVLTSKDVDVEELDKPSSSCRTVRDPAERCAVALRDGATAAGTHHAGGRLHRWEPG